MFGGLRLSAERLLTAALILVSVTHAGAASSSKPACVLAATRFDSQLTRTWTRLAEGRPITIVAVGSSSTAGAGATTSAASYPSRLEAFLQARFPHNSIRVINRGVNGEEEGDMLARFERDVIAEKPDLVLWQVGSNAVMRDRSLVMEEILINAGVQRLKSAGADVVLVDPQYTAAIAGKVGTVPMLEIIDAQGRDSKVGVFHRFALMKHWHDSQELPFDTFSIADGLHMNDWGYDCFARNLAAAIGDPVAPAAVAMGPSNPMH